MDQPVKEEDRIEKDISRDREGSEVGEEENETRNGFEEEEEVVDKQEEKESKGKKGKHGGGRIKRPMNAFMVWSSLERKKLAEKEPNLHNTELSKRLGQMWKEMTEEDKTPYRQEATRLKDKLMEDHPEYKYKPRRRKDLRHIQTSTSNVGLFSSHVIADRSYSAPPVPPILPSSNSLYHYNNPDMIDGVGSGQTHYPYYHSTPTSPHHINSIMPHNMFPPHYYHPHLGGSPPAAFQIGGSSNQLALQQHTGHLPHLAQGGPPAADLRLECTMTSVGCDSTIPTGLVTSTYFQFPSPLVVSSSPSSPTSPVYASETPPCSPYMPSSTTSIQSYSISETSNTTQVTTSPRDACSPTFLSPPLSSPSPYPLREPYYTHFRYSPEDFIQPVPPNYATSPTLHMGTGREGGYMYNPVPPTLIKMDGPHNIQQSHPSSLKLEQGDCTCGTNYPVMAPFSPNSPLSAVSEGLPISPDLTPRKPPGTETNGVFF